MKVLLLFAEVENFAKLRLIPNQDCKNSSNKNALILIVNTQSKSNRLRRKISSFKVKFL